MTGPEFQFAYLRDSRLAAHALNPAPVWLWSVNADRILWANPTGASIFDATSPGALAALHFNSPHATAAQIARLAGTLPQGAAPRLERLRGFGGGIGGTLICLCSRITLADNSAAILMVSTERAGKDLALSERARRLLEDFQLPAAIFTADGELIEAQAAARERLGKKLDLVALGAEKLAREATLNGAADGKIRAGHITILKLGAGPTFTLLVVFTGSGMRLSADALAPAARPPVAPNPAELETRSRLLPLRFVWRTDAGGCFSLANEEFANLLGPETVAALNRSWTEIATTLNFDPQGQIANALAARETFSDIVVFWPVNGTDERVAVEMSGLPVFDRERQFKGFRGFGICRNVSRLEEIHRLRKQTASASPSPIATEPESKVVTEPESKVLPFPSVPPPPVAEPVLSAREHSAFQELARELNERLKRAPAKTEIKAPSDFDVEPFIPPAQPANETPKIGRDAQESRPILDRLPVGILVYRLNSLIYANRAFLDWTGYSTLEALNEAGGLDSLFIEGKIEVLVKATRNGAKSLTIATVNGKQKPVEGRLSSVVWNNENALLLVINTHVGSDDIPAEVLGAPRE